MQKLPNYPQNRLDIRIDENGNVTYEQNPEFAKYYAPTRAEKEEELEEHKSVMMDALNRRSAMLNDQTRLNTMLSAMENRLQEITESAGSMRKEEQKLEEDL